MSGAAGESAPRRRTVVDYGLRRRALLADLAAGRVSRLEACDAQPYLLRAAPHHGEQTDRACPVCERGRLVDVRYVYGDTLGARSGGVRSSAELAGMARQVSAFTVYVVEVCRGCAWNHLVTSYVLGSG